MDISKIAEQEAPDLIIYTTQHNTDLIYGPKSLHENSRNQLGSHSTPDNLKVKNRCAEMGKKSWFISTMSAPSPSQQSSWFLGKAHLEASLLEGKKELSSNIQVFGECLGAWF